jgi:hypothetical protein
MYHDRRSSDWPIVEIGSQVIVSAMLNWKVRFLKTVEELMVMETQLKE